jgi:hypothetical protein
LGGTSKSNTISIESQEGCSSLHRSPQLFICFLFPTIRVVAVVQQAMEKILAEKIRPAFATLSALVPNNAICSANEEDGESNGENIYRYSC